MKTARCRHKVVLFENKIYAVGGIVMSSVECYDKSSDQWTDAPNMKSKRYCHGVTVVGDRLYAVGGHDGKSRLSSAEYLSSSATSWVTIKDMFSSRSKPVVSSLNECLYVAGGQHMNNSIIKNVERYDSERDEWILVGNMQKGRSDAASVAHMGVFFVIGGNGDTYSEGTWELFNPLSNKWTLQLPLLPNILKDSARACVVTVKK